MKVNKWFGLVCIAAIMSSCAVSSDEKKENNGYENDVIKTIMERRSIRKYQDKPVSRDILQTLVECGVNAPNAVNRQQWQVRVVDNASYIDGISAVYKAANPKVEQNADFKNMFRNAPAVIFRLRPDGREYYFGGAVFGAWNLLSRWAGSVYEAKSRSGRICGKVATSRRL